MKVEAGEKNLYSKSIVDNILVWKLE